MSSLKVLFLTGLPGSGKSTYAYKYIKNNSNFVRINKDDIRDMLSKKYTSIESMFSSSNLLNMFGADASFASECEDSLVNTFKEQRKSIAETVKKGKLNPVENLVLDVENAIIKFAVLKGKSIVSDNTNYNPKHYDRFQKFCKGYAFERYDMHKDGKVTLDTCLKQNKGRDRVVPEVAIYSMAKQYRVFEQNTSDVKNVKYETENRVVICDIDGTIARIDHRLHLIDKSGGKKPNWQAFFALMDKDELREDVKSILDDVYPNHDVVFVSGRPDNYREVTEKWLKDHGVRYNALYMRRANDRRPDTEAKQEILDSYLPKDKIDAVIDDRGSVISMWASNGLKVINVAEGNNDF